MELATATQPLRADDAARVGEVLKAVLHRTVQAMKQFPDSILKHAEAALTPPQYDGTAGAAAAALAWLAQGIAKATRPRNWTVASDRPPYIATEAVIDVATALKRHPGELGAAQQVVLVSASRELEQAWRRGLLTVDGMAALLRHLQPTLSQPGLETLCDAVGDAAGRLEAHAAQGLVPIRLHDNIYRRAYETHLAALLANRPLAGTCKAADRLKRHFAALLRGCSPAQAKEVARLTGLMVIEDWPRPWSDVRPELTVLGRAALRKDRDGALRSLQEFLSKPAHPGPAHIAIFHLGMRMVRAIHSVRSDLVPFAAEANDFYREVVVPLKGGSLRDTDEQFSRVPDLAAFARAHGTGPMLPNHPPALPTGSPTLRHAYKRVPDLDAAAAAVSRAMSSGMPVVTGPSGSACLMVYTFVAVAHVDASGGGANESFEIKHAVLGLLAWLVHDGGHSLQEVLSIVHLLAPILGFEWPCKSGADGRYVADLDEIFSFYDAPDRKQLMETADQAWERMLEYSLQLRKHFGTGSSGAVKEPASDSR
jgi:hypothetical protein